MEKKFDPTKPTQTRNGLKVEIICADLRGTSRPIGGKVTFNDGSQSLRQYASDGMYFNEVSVNDLVNIPEKKTGWLNIYPPCEIIGVIAECSCNLFTTKANADVAARANRIACVEVHWEE
jgi:hypothetical protein